MKLKFKILIILIAFLNVNFAFCASNFGVYTYQENVIDASKNAHFHNNLGNVYFEEKNYIGALAEYETAFNLSPNDNLSAYYLYNIAKCYMTLKRFELAKNALLGAIGKNCMNITYYSALVECFFELNIQKYELEKYLKDKTNPYNEIIAGLIYIKMNDKTSAKIILDEFITKNPNMLITPDVKNILGNL